MPSEVSVAARELVRALASEPGDISLSSREARRLANALMMALLYDKEDYVATAKRPEAVYRSEAEVFGGETIHAGAAADDAADSELEVCSMLLDHMNEQMMAADRRLASAELKLAAAAT